jgi:hypothetical protein
VVLSTSSGVVVESVDVRGRAAAASSMSVSWGDWICCRFEEPEDSPSAAATFRFMALAGGERQPELEVRMERWKLH